MAFFSRCHWLLQWLILSVLALALYIPVLGNSFVNDDFLVLKKVCVDGHLNTEGFFRPLSDISLYGNYLLGGLNPMGYYLTNVLLHALNALLLFQFCQRWQLTQNEDQQRWLASLAALFFLTYPFHNEAVAWVLGRASLLAATFTFLSLVVLVSKWKEPWKITAVACFYFIGAMAYESIFVLPGIVLAWQLANKYSFKKIITWMAVLAFVLISHFILRILVSGSVAGEYGSQLISPDLVFVAAKAAKAAGRLFIPPLKDPVWFSLLALFCYIGMGVVVWLFWKKHSGARYMRKQFLFLSAMALLTLLLPFAIGVSTNSSESDRFLYLPSYFICIIIAFLLVNGLKSGRWFVLLSALILMYNIIFLELNNRNWQQASEAVSSLLQIAKEKPADGKLYIVNLPDEKNGAFIFRVGFMDALLIRGVDTSSVKVVNRGIMRELDTLPAIVPRREQGALFIPPEVMVQRKDDSSVLSGSQFRTILISDSDRVAYWNAHRWLILP